MILNPPLKSSFCSSVPYRKGFFFFAHRSLKILTKRTLDPYQKSWSPTRCTLSLKLDSSLGCVGEDTWFYRRCVHGSASLMESSPKYMACKWAWCSRVSRKIDSYDEGIASCNQQVWLFIWEHRCVVVLNSGEITLGVLSNILSYTHVTIMTVIGERWLRAMKLQSISEDAPFYTWNIKIEIEFVSRGQGVN